MKILYISYAKYGSGWWVHTSQFLSSIKELHSDIYSYTPLISSSQKTEKSPAKSYQYVPGPFRELRYLSVVFTRHALGELIQLIKIAPDVVILRCDRYLSSLILCRLLKIPIIAEVNSSVIEERFSPKQHRFRRIGLWQKFEIVTLRLANHIFVVSEPLRQYFIHNGIPSNTISVVPNGVDTKKFHYSISGESIRRKLGLDGKIVIGFSGHFAPWHGIDFLIKGMKKLFQKYPDMADNLRVLLIGHPGYGVVIPDVSDERFIITGHIHHDEMPFYLAAVDIFTAPYPLIAPFYFSPLKIFEAMSMRKPVIASAQGQICDLITDGISGYLYSPGNMDEFLEKLTLLILRSDLRESIGKAARLTMETHYTWKKNAKNILTLCRCFVSQKY